MLAETDNLNLKILKRDKVALRRLAANEGEHLSVVVRRILRKELERNQLLPTGSQFNEGARHEKR